MIDAKQYQIRERDKAGRLTASGFVFYEQKPRSANLRGCLVPILLIVIIFAGFGVFFGIGFGKSELLFTSGFVAVAAITVIRMFFWPRKMDLVKRTIVFFEDDCISIPNRKSADPENILSQVKVSNIHSIESGPALNAGQTLHISDGYRWFPVWQVNLHLRDGQTFWYATNLVSENDARFIAVQLNLALSELREDSWRWRADEGPQGGV